MLQAYHKIEISVLHRINRNLSIYRTYICHLGSSLLHDVMDETFFWCEIYSYHQIFSQPVLN
jgi:hypothetical protein